MPTSSASLRSQRTARLLDAGAAAVIRLDDARTLRHVIAALHAGGVIAIEITMTVPDALRLLRETADAIGTDLPDDVLLGVGSVLDADTVHAAVEAGAQFVVSPIFKPEIIEAAHAHDAPALPGAFTPTEVQTATEAGADVVKVFPASLLGMKFIKAVRAPMPHLKLMPTGGVTPENAGDWLRAGAVAVGVGSALVDKQAIAEARFDVLTEKARTLTASITAART
jgi:2-dehydro-3-deoxyphosphogluconate aldolase/(4S)-4-hydroxy-2-oxoglutarate aldolase